MTYVNTTEQIAARIPARGQITSTAPFLNAGRGLELLGNFFKAIGDSIMRASEASSRVHQVQALQAKSDAELARMGIKRDMIAHHVFKDLFYC